MSMMDAQCPSCGAHYRVDPARLAAAGSTVACRGCGHRWSLRPQPSAPPSEPVATEAICPECGHAFSHVPAAVGAASRHRILVVEDQDYFVQLAREALGEGFQTVSVRTPEAALREIARRPPPATGRAPAGWAGGGDGREVLRSLPRRSFPVLIFTSKDEQEMYGAAWKELQELGADDLLLKGMNVSDDLQRKVEELLARRA